MENLRRSLRSNRVQRTFAPTPRETACFHEHFKMQNGNRYCELDCLRRTIQHEQPESNGTISEMVYSSIGESSPLRLVGEQRSNQASIWNQSGIQHGSNQRHPL